MSQAGRLYIPPPDTDAPYTGVTPAAAQTLFSSLANHALTSLQNVGSPTAGAYTFEMSCKPM
jgi:hypothetical protein